MLDSLGLALAAVLTVGSFYVVRTTAIWGPGIAVALAVLAIAQIGAHLVLFFSHITTAPDNTDNVLALAFGVLIVALAFGGGSLVDHEPSQLQHDAHVSANDVK